MANNEGKNEKTVSAVTPQEAPAAAKAPETQPNPKKAPKPAGGKNRVKTVHFTTGCDLIGGGKLGMRASRNVEIEATGIGIKMTSKGSQRVVVIPYGNVKGFELFPETPEE